MRRSKFIVSCDNSNFPLLVVQNYHGAPVVEKIVRQLGAKGTDASTQSKAQGVSVDNIRPSMLTPQEIPVWSMSAFSE